MDFLTVNYYCERSKANFDRLLAAALTTKKINCPKYQSGNINKIVPSALGDNAIFLILHICSKDLSQACRFVLFNLAMQGTSTVLLAHVRAQVHVYTVWA